MYMHKTIISVSEYMHNVSVGLSSLVTMIFATQTRVARSRFSVSGMSKKLLHHSPTRLLIPNYPTASLDQVDSRDM